VNRALEDVQKNRNDPIPLHLRNAVTDLMQELGYSQGYKYPHDYDGNFVKTKNLPESLEGRRYYEPGNQGYETEVSERLHKWWGNDQNA